MVDIILQKGKDAFDLFVKALQSEHHHIGHKSLAETLQTAKKDSRRLSQPSSTLPTSLPTRFSTPPCPRKKLTHQAPGLSILSHVNPRRHSNISKDWRPPDNHDQSKKSSSKSVDDNQSMRTSEV